MVDAADLKSASLYREWGFESLPGHTILQGLRLHCLLDLPHVYSELQKKLGTWGLIPRDFPWQFIMCK